jgi:DNA-directed RNA polymerase subunit K/omega
VTDQSGVADQTPDTQPEKPASGPPQSRFLFVDIAALRAKQLRRGAAPRLEKPADGEPPRLDVPRKPERVAMEEVRRGLVSFQLPDLKPPTGGPLP